MFDTNLAVVGNVLTAPEWRRLDNSGSLVAHFRVASTARRFDREKAQWVDGNSLRVRVTAWRRLAEGVASSIAVGDPVVVYGRLYCRDWQDEHGKNRVAYEMEAFSIGHDLARGRARFFRTRLAPTLSELETPEAETFIRGETSVPLTADEAPVAYGDGLPDQLADQEPTFADAAPAAAPIGTTTSPGKTAAPHEPEETAAPHEPARPTAPHEPARPTTPSEPARAAATHEPARPKSADEPTGAPTSRKAAGKHSPSEATAAKPGPSEATATEPAPAEEPELESPSEADDLTLEVERLVAEQQPTSPRRRGRPGKREPVPA